VNEFHVLVFDPSQQISNSSAAQTTRGVLFPCEAVRALNVRAVIAT